MVTISDIRKMGFEVPDDIGDDEFTDTEEDAARDEVLQGDTWRYHERYTPDDPPSRKVKFRTIWVKADYDEDGIAELQRVIRIGDTILEREEVSRIPVSCIVPFINTHRHIGNSVADLTFDIQRIKTALLRGGLDSLNLSINPRHAVSSEVNLDDLLVSRSGGVVRLRNGAIPGQGHVVPLQTEFVFPQAQEGLRHMDTVTESRVGVNRIFQGIDEGVLNDHNRIGQLSTMAAQRVEQIARLFANGVERLFSLAHELLLKSGHQEETIKLRGQWVNVNPSNWKHGRDMRVVAPFAAGNKDSLLQRLMLIVGLQEKALAAGLPIADADDAYRLALEIASAADVPGDRFFTDPATIPPQEPPPDYTMLALEVENKKVDAGIQEDQVKAELEEQKLELEKYKADLQAQIDVLTNSDEHRIDIDKYKADLEAFCQAFSWRALRVRGSLNLEILKSNIAQSSKELDESSEAERVSLEQTISELKASTQELGESLSQKLEDALSAPREVIRDDTGQVIGVRVNGQTRKVQRDEEGRVVGI